MGRIENAIIVVTGTVYSLRDEVAERLAQHFGIEHYALPAVLEADIVEARLHQKESVKLQAFNDKRLIDEARAAQSNGSSRIISGPLSVSSAQLLSAVTMSNPCYRGVEVSCIQTSKACCFYRLGKFCKQRRIELPQNAYSVFMDRLQKASSLGMRKFDHWDQILIREETLDNVQFSELFAHISQNEPLGV